MIEGFKPLYNKLLKPLVRPLVKIGIHPNHLTLGGVVLFGIAAWFAKTGSWQTALVFMIVGGMLDGLDGVLARESNQKSVFGAVLDSSCDRVTEIFLFFGILAYFLTAPLICFSRNSLTIQERGWGVVLCYGAVTMSLLVSYVKARCEGAGIPCKGGIMQRPERLIVLGIGLLLGPHVMIWILGGITVLGAFTVVERLYEAYRGSKTAR